MAQLLRAVEVGGFIHHATLRGDSLLDQAGADEIVLHLAAGLVGKRLCWDVVACRFGVADPWIGGGAAEHYAATIRRGGFILLDYLFCVKNDVAVLCFRNRPTKLGIAHSI